MSFKDALRDFWADDEAQMYFLKQGLKELSITVKSPKRIILCGCSSSLSILCAKGSCPLFQYGMVNSVAIIKYHPVSVNQ